MSDISCFFQSEEEMWLNHFSQHLIFFQTLRWKLTFIIGLHKIDMC